jgi:hypothetical protein
MKGSESLAADGVFVICGANALTETPLQPHVVWLGSVDGDVHGIITSALGYVDGANRSEVLRHAFISAIQRCFLSEELVDLMGTDPVDLDLVFEDLATTEFGDSKIEVDGASVVCRRTVYRGVEFACGHDPVRWPFTVARRSGASRDWPPLAQRALA